MRNRLTRISPVRTAWTMTLVYLFLMVILWVIFGLLSLFAIDMQSQGLGPLPVVGLGFLGLIFYAVVSFVGGLIFAWIYNLIAKWTGGIEFDLNEVEEKQEKK